MSERPTVVGALRAFLPQFQTAEPALSPQQRRAIWAITHCRTAALGGRAFVCHPCNQVHFAYHSCNHKACPQCGALATRRWVAREVHKLLNAPYFLVTFTLPSQLRGCFFGVTLRAFPWTRSQIESWWKPRGLRAGSWSSGELM